MKCMVMGKSLLNDKLLWELDYSVISTEETLDILGVSFSCTNSYCHHIEQRVTSARRAIFSISAVGMTYPGLSTEVKTHLWKTIGLPSLLYGLKCVYMYQTLL